MERKLELVKVLIREELMSRRSLVRLGCEEEVEACQAYLEQLKDQYMKYPLAQLEAMARQAQARVA